MTDSNSLNEAGVPAEALAVLVSDCWEPGEDPNCLYDPVTWMRPYSLDEAEAAGIGCLRVVDGEVANARVMLLGDSAPPCEDRRRVEYFWVLWAGSKPTREQLIATFRVVVE